MISLATSAALAANSAEVTTSNVRAGAAFDNIKASWNKALNIGDMKADLKANYDYNSNKDFLKDVSLSGDLTEAGSLAVSYEVNHNFQNKNTEVKLTAVSDGTTLSADYDTEDQLKEVGLAREVEVGDQKVDFQPSWLVKAKTARVKLMSGIGGGGDKLSAQIDYATEGGSASYELGYSHSLEEGRDVSATFKADDKDLEVEYVDSTFENGATWTAKATVPVGDANNILDAAALTLKRSWSW